MAKCSDRNPLGWVYQKNAKLPGHTKFISQCWNTWDEFNSTHNSSKTIYLSIYLFRIFYIYFNVFKFI